MLVLRLLVMVFAIICLMDGHAEVSSSTTGMKNGGESPAVKQNETEVQILDRKKKKKPKPGKKKKPKPGKRKPKPNKEKPKPTKPVTTTPIVSTSPLKTSTILTSPTITTTATKTTMTVSPTTTATRAKTTTTTATTTTTVATSSISSTASTTITTIPTTATTFSPSITAATTADSGGECKATNGQSCIFPYKDGEKEYNECKNEGGKYFWCATAVYDSGKYKHWSYCSTDGPCPLEGDGECRAANNKPCVFPFKDGKKDHNECADFSGKYYWCATGTNSVGKYTSWSKCPQDGSCPLSSKSTMPLVTTTATTASTTSPNNDTSAAASAIANIENTLNEINDTLQTLETAGFTEDEKQLLETMHDLTDYLKSGSITRNFYDSYKINSWSQQLYSTAVNIKATKQITPGFFNSYQTEQATCSIAAQNAKLSQANAGPGRMFQLSTISEILAIVTNIPSSSSCCAACKAKATDSELFEHSNYYKQCDCYKTISGVVPETMFSSTIHSGVCKDKGTCQLTRKIQCIKEFDEVHFQITDYQEGIGLYTLKTQTTQNTAQCGAACMGIANRRCSGFIFDTCDPNNCILLTRDYNAISQIDKPTDFMWYTNYCAQRCRTKKGKECKFPYDADGLKNYGCAYDHEKQYFWCYTRSLLPFTKSIDECPNDNTCELENECTPRWLKRYQGVATVKKTTRLVGGYTAPTKDTWKEWPWLASLMRDDSDGRKYRCSATLISCQHVVTAKHCLYDTKTFIRVTSPDKMWISLGSIKHAVNLQPNELRAIDYIVYKDGSVLQRGNDIAVLILKEKIDILTGIRPILLPTDEVDIPINSKDKENTEPSINFYITGWGLTTEGEFGLPTDDFKISNELKLRPASFCDFYKNYDAKRQICLEKFEDHATHKGDSGSPGMTELGGKWYIQGVYSGSLNLLTNYGQAGMATLVDVYSYRDDLRDIINGEIPTNWIVKI